MSPKDEGGNDENAFCDECRRAPVECRRLGANRDGVLERSRRGCSGQVDDGLGRKQSRHHRGALFQDAVLWGTLSPTVRSDPAALKAYVVGAFQALPKLTVKFGEQLIRVYGDTAVNTGYYTFAFTKDGETKSLPARYSLTYVKEGNDCKIVDHHSSAMPAPPK
jgi:hypothetical protein